MLRNVLGDYLNGVREREFDLPFLTLLPELGFYDVHFTHGQVEFGKDFIAKRVDGGEKVQYSFQSKAGDIKQGDWRNDVMGQMLQAVISGLSHPNFDRTLPHQAVLVTTGRLAGNVALDLQEFNQTVETSYGKRRVQVRDAPRLLGYLERYGLEAVYGATAADFVSYGGFYVLYGKLLEGDISERDIEKQSRHWLSAKLSPSKSLLGAALESEILAQRCLAQGFWYEAIHAYLGALRVMLYRLHAQVGSTQAQATLDVAAQAMKKVRSVTEIYIHDVERRWRTAGEDLVELMTGTGVMITYLVHCARVMEMAGYLYLAEDEPAKRERLLPFIADFMTKEPGCAHPASDHYAISLVLPVLALIEGQRADIAGKLLHSVIVWLCDRYEKGTGLADVEASADIEVEILLGYAFDFLGPRPSPDSLLATVACDLVAFLGDKKLYRDAVNDIKATRIFPGYYQVKDTLGQFRIDGDDVLTYPNVEYSDELIDPFEAYTFAAHIGSEPKTYAVVPLAGPMALMSIMLLLRDRYFPTLWPMLAKPRTQEE